VQPDGVVENDIFAQGLPELGLGFVPQSYSSSFFKVAKNDSTMALSCGLPALEDIRVALLLCAEFCAPRDKRAVCVEPWFFVLPELYLKGYPEKR
jgi:hypothetical protein